MRLLLLTDIHGHTEKLEKIVKKEDFDAILCAGDLSDATEYDDYSGKLEQVLEAMQKQGNMAKAVPGNMDPEEKCLEQLIERRMNIHKKIASFEDFEVVGFGGGITPFGTPFEPSGGEIKSALEQLYGRMNTERKFAVIHQPPHDTQLDLAEGNHVGSQEVRDLIEKKDFELVLTGHIHEARGKDTVGDTLIVNPGPVLEGYYAILDTSGNLEMKSLN
ncbi:MAG: metallophosphoesterase [Candidatus Nanohaloarchaea archaeon]